MRLLALLFFVNLAASTLSSAQPPAVDSVKQVEVDSEIDADFPGGTLALFKFLSTEIVYPADAMAYGIQGTCYLNFTVEKDGTLTQINVKRGLFPSIDSTVLAVAARMPKWTPASSNGNLIRVQKTVPVKFRLDNSVTDVKPWVKVTPASDKKIAQPCGEGAKSLVPYQKPNARPIQAQIWDAITPYDVPMDGIDTLEVLMTLDQAGTVTEVVAAKEGKGSNSRISNKTKAQIIEAFKALAPFNPASCNGKSVETTLRYYVILERAKPTTPPRSK
jgi:TonB family protein